MGGNILSKSAYAYTTGTVSGTPTTITYTYDTTWKDQMSAYNGAALTYDAMGNPLTDGTWTYTWQKGRQLASMTSGSTTVSFAYNADGLRVRKTVGSTVTNYTMHGKNIMHLTRGTDDLHFFYDAQNRPAIVLFNGTAYGYIYNLQGDVVALVNTSGTKVVTYRYDAWGRVLSKAGTMVSTLGTVQPFRYRGYVFDEETGLYYMSVSSQDGFPSVIHYNWFYRQNEEEYVPIKNRDVFRELSSIFSVLAAGIIAIFGITTGIGSSIPAPAW